MFFLGSKISVVPPTPPPLSESWCSGSPGRVMSLFCGLPQEGERGAGEEGRGSERWGREPPGGAIQGQDEGPRGVGQGCRLALGARAHLLQPLPPLLPAPHVPVAFLWPFRRLPTLTVHCARERGVRMRCTVSGALCGSNGNHRLIRRYVRVAGPAGMCVCVFWVSVGTSVDQDRFVQRNEPCGFRGNYLVEIITCLACLLWQV